MAGKKKFNWLKWLLMVAVLGGAVVAGVAYVKHPKDASLDFKTARAVQGEITQAVTANGALNPVRTVTVGSQISGIITELKVDFNSKVREGDELARIDPATYERALARAEADLANAQAGLELAKFNAKRARELYTNRLISESEWEQTEVALKQADANVKIRQASVDSAKVDLDRTTIYAPISGMVISRKVDAGQTVAASFNTPELFTIANDLTKMQIETLVSEADVGGVQEGQKVNFMVDAFQARKFSGRVTHVRFAPITNRNVVRYTAVVEVDNRDLKLRPGMTATASIIPAQRKTVLCVPNAAFRFRPPENAIIGSTNDAVARAASTNAPAGMPPPGDMPVPPWAAERRRPTEEERKKFEDSLTPEQKEQYRQMRERMRAMMAEGGGMSGAGGAGGMMMFSGGNRSGSPNDGPAIRKVYLLDKERSTPGKPVLAAVSVKTGISDGSNTEVQEGLKEGDVVIIGTSTATTTAATTTVNPFGGPFGGPRR